MYSTSWNMGQQSTELHELAHELPPRVPRLKLAPKPSPRRADVQENPCFTTSYSYKHSLNRSSWTQNGTSSTVLPIGIPTCKYTR